MFNFPCDSTVIILGRNYDTASYRVVMMTQADDVFRERRFST